jgi:hypothetical protein
MPATTHHHEIRRMALAKTPDYPSLPATSLRSGSDPASLFGMVDIGMLSNRSTTAAITDMHPESVTFAHLGLLHM